MPSGTSVNIQSNSTHIPCNNALPAIILKYDRCGIAPSPGVRYFNGTIKKRIIDKTTFQRLETPLGSVSVRMNTNMYHRKGDIMVTNPVGKGTKTIGINMPSKMANDLEKRAASMHISKSNYCKIILQQWIDSGNKLTLGEK